MIAKLLVTILVILSGWLALQWMDAESRIEAGVLNEIVLTNEREFLMRLPAMMKVAGSKDALLELLKQKYPNVLVEDFGQDICWGLLRLKFDSPSELDEVTEGCPKP